MRFFSPFGFKGRIQGGWRERVELSTGVSVLMFTLLEIVGIFYLPIIS